MLLDIRIKPVVFILNKKKLYRTLDKVLYVCKDHLIHEESMYNGNSCHDIASYYSNKT
jgi:hypothetical protein